MIRALLLLGGCAAVGAATEIATQVGTSNQSAWTVRTVVLAGDSATLSAGWTQLHRGDAMHVPQPVVDFRHSRVVFAAAGSQRSGGYRLQLSGAQSRHDSTLIELALVAPPAGCGVTQEITTPAIALVVEGRSSPVAVSIHERADTTRC